MRYAIAAAAAIGMAIVALAFAAAAANRVALATTPTLPPTVSATPTSTATVTATITQTPTSARNTATPFPRPNTPTPFPPQPTPIQDVNFWISVDGSPNCNTRNGDATCTIAPGVAFVADVYLDPLPSEVRNYGGFDVSLRHSGVIPNHDANMGAWPDCVFAGAAYDELPSTDIVRFGCTVGIPPAGGSTYVGLIGTISFGCIHSGSVSMVHGLGQTDLIEFEHFDPGHIHIEDPNTSETLNINCGASTLPAAGSGGLGGDGRGPWLIILAALAMGGALVVVGGLAARAQRRPG